MLSTTNYAGRRKPGVAPNKLQKKVVDEGAADYNLQKEEENEEADDDSLQKE